LFHAGRLISFFILGGVIGVIGKNVQLSTTGIFILDVVVAFVLFILGINLLNIFPWAQRLQLAMPKGISQRLLRIQQMNSTVTPALVGGITFFLPCGFTQSMQLYALSTGSFASGALTMLSFALGTLPVLAALSFTSFSIRKPSTQSVFFKAAGLVVIFFAIFNFLAGLVVLGILPPLLNI
jgi:sulfite exporter TauE/SafE